MLLCYLYFIFYIIFVFLFVLFFIFFFYLCFFYLFFFLSFFFFFFFFFSSRRRHTRCSRDWSSDVCSSDLMTKLLIRTSCCLVLFVSCLQAAAQDQRKQVSANFNNVDITVLTREDRKSVV